MPIRIDETGASEDQLQNLRRARSGRMPEGDLVELLTYIARDRDILAGREPLHPDWAEIYADLQSAVRRALPLRIFKRLDDFFSQARSFDPKVAEIDPSASSLVFLLGAGASKPEPSGIPTVQELLPDLLSRARRLDREDVTRLADFCERSKITDIEDLLTAARLSEFCSRNSDVLRLVEFLLFREEPDEELLYRRRSRPSVDVSSVAFLQDTLQVLFGLLSSRMLPAKPNDGHKAIVKYLRDHPGAPIVTTNYDCCMDLALTESDIPFSYQIEFANPGALPAAAGDKSPLIKLHGSLNWFYCETCQDVHWIDIQQTVGDDPDDKAPYPVIGVCRGCGGQRRGLLVPPLAMKFDVAPPLNPLIDKAALSFADADVIVVVGFSFADADLYIYRMVSKAMQASKNARLLIFDPDRAIVQKVRRKFSNQIPQFDASRIIRVAGDCAATLPEFLSGELYGVEISYS